MFKLKFCKIKNINQGFNVNPLKVWAMICIAAILSIALPVRAQNEETSAVKKMQPSSEAPGESDDSATTKNAIENSRYFRFGLSGAFGRFRYKEDWGSSDTLNEIGRYQGPGIESALELGRQWKSGFAFGAAFQLGLFPRLHRFSLDSVSNAVQSETLKIKFLMVGFVFLHHPFGIKNGYYIAIRPGVSLMNGMPYSVPIPLPGFSVAMGYDFFNRAKAHLGVEAKVTAVFGKGSMDFNDFSSCHITGRLVSFSLTFTVAYY